MATPDIESLGRTITEAYRNDHHLDGLECDDLERRGLREDQIRLIRDTIFIESPGELVPAEAERYQEAGLGELARLLGRTPVTPPLGIKYWGGGIAAGYGRFVFHNPLDLKNPFPNDTSTTFGLDLAVGWGRSNDEELPLMERPLQAVGELHLTFFRGATHDKIDMTKEARDLARTFTAGAEVALETEIKNQTGMDVDLDFSRIDFGEVVIRRDAVFYIGFIQVRRYLTGFKPLDRWNFGDLYINLGLGGMYTSTNISVLGASTEVSEFSLLGRVAAEMDVVRLTYPHWIVSLRGGIGFMAGEQGGPDATAGLVFFYRP